MIKDRKTLTIPEAVKVAKVSTRTLMRWLASGLLPAHHPGRGMGPAIGRKRVKIKVKDLNILLAAKHLCWPGKVIGSRKRIIARNKRLVANLTPKQQTRATRKVNRRRRMAAAARKSAR